MKKTILITGASSGIGKVTADFFASKGWNVAATMRNPSKSEGLFDYSSIKIYKLDVLDEESIKSAVSQTISDFGQIDVLLNNAGYAATGLFEAFDQDQIRRQFDTNVFGLMNVIRTVLPHLKKRGEGRIINVSSVGGHITLPLYSLYHGTKWAVEGFSESLHYELAGSNIKVKLVEPGAIKTDFYDRSMDVNLGYANGEEREWAENAFNNMQEAGTSAPGPEVVARKVYQAATDRGNRMRYPVGSGAPMLIILKKLLPNFIFFGMIKSVVNKKRKAGSRTWVQA